MVHLLAGVLVCPTPDCCCLLRHTHPRPPPPAACAAVQYVFEVSRGCGNPFLDLLRLRRTTLRLGFTSSQEALGWYVYAAACARIMSDADPDFSKVSRCSCVATAAAAGALLQDSIIKQCKVASKHGWFVKSQACW